jgi:hypothetical protein
VRKLLFLGLALTLLFAGCCNMEKEIDSAKEIAEIKQVIDISIGWALHSDINALYDALAQDENFFIYHPQSTGTIKGFKAFKAYAERIFLNPAFKATAYEIKDLKVNLSPTGQTAWYSCLLDDYGEWNGTPMGWDNARWTGVLEKREGKWLIVQMHFSLATDAQSSEE